MEYLDIHCPAEGKLSLSMAAVRLACGDPRDFPRMEWQHRDYRHGEALPLGMVNPTPPPLSDRDALRMTRAEMDAYAEACRPVEGYLPAFQPFPVKRRKAVPAATAPVSAQEAVPAPVAAPVPVPAPAGDTGAILARLARLEALAGIVAAPKRTARHEAAIRRAWAMRGQYRARQDLDRRALAYANGVNAALRDQIDEKAAQLVAVEAARAAAVYRAQCDEARTIDAEARAMDAEAALAGMTAERDAALDMAGEEEAATMPLRGKLADARERGDRLARIAMASRRRLVAVTADAAASVSMANASERRASRKLEEMRKALDQLPIAKKAVARLAAAA